MAKATGRKAVVLLVILRWPPPIDTALTGLEQLLREKMTMHSRVKNSHRPLLSTVFYRIIHPQPAAYIFHLLAFDITKVHYQQVGQSVAP